MTEGFIYDDGGREAAGYRGPAGDCVTRAVTIASGRPYREIYVQLAVLAGMERRSKGRSARNGIHVTRKWFKTYMAALGSRWHPTMLIGSGTTVHLCAEELPAGRLVVSVSKHYTAMLDGVVHDTHDARRERHTAERFPGWETCELKPGQSRNVNGIWSIQRRCVYGYWQLEDVSPEALAYWNRELNRSAP